MSIAVRSSGNQGIKALCRGHPPLGMGGLVKAAVGPLFQPHLAEGRKVRRFQQPPSLAHARRLTLTPSPFPALPRGSQSGQEISKQVQKGGPPTQILADSAVAEGKSTTSLMAENVKPAFTGSSRSRVPASAKETLLHNLPTACSH